MIQSLAKNVAASFDKNAGDFVRTQFAEQISQIDIAINSSSLSKSIGKNTRGARQFP